MGPQGKKPKRATDPQPRRQPAAPAAQNWNRERPTWSFSKLDFDGPWGCGRVDGSALENILRKLRDFETMTWAEMQQGGKHCAATQIPVENLTSKAQARLAEIASDDVADLWELHIAGKPRLWGIRLEAVFYLIWFDLDHEVCPSHLRHT